MAAENRPARTFTVEIDSEQEPLRGRVREGDRAAHEFSGWLGLAKALERVLSDSPAPPAAPPAS